MAHLRTCWPFLDLKKSETTCLPASYYQWQTKSNEKKNVKFCKEQGVFFKLFVTGAFHSMTEKVSYRPVRYWWFTGSRDNNLCISLL